MLQANLYDNQEYISHQKYNFLVTLSNHPTANFRGQLVNEARIRFPLCQRELQSQSNATLSEVPLSESITRDSNMD